MGDQPVDEYSAAEVAALTQVRVARVWAAAPEGALPFRRVRGAYLFAEPDVVAFMSVVSNERHDVLASIMPSGGYRPGDF